VDREPADVADADAAAQAVVAAVEVSPAETALSDAWREHWARLMAILVQQHGDLDLAEECLADAFAAAAESWVGGVPDRPAAWLLTVARRRAVDRLRRRTRLAQRLPLLVRDAEPAAWPDDRDADGLPDERLRLVCTCCHPALSHEASVALTLKLVGGLSTREVARSFLVSETTMAARITRAKRKIALAGIPFRVPDASELPARLARVCAVTYLLFTEGYAATAGPQLQRRELCAEAIRLQRLVVELVPDDPEALGLLALMLLQHARRDARVSDGRLVPLAEQDRDRWHGDEVAHARALLESSAALAPTPGGYTTQAAIALEHLRAPTAGETDWRRICRLYAHLEAVAGSPVVRLNRAVAVAEADGAQAGLALLDGLEASLPRYHLLPATRAELLGRLGRLPEAAQAYDVALDLVATEHERAHLENRRARLLRRAGVGRRA
jgi:RNA polymerase sigma-70 factor (ECF subfamily)